MACRLSSTVELRFTSRGSYQVIVRQLIPQGVGALELAFRQMHAKLEAEGLFNPARKRPIPRFPKRIARDQSVGSCGARHDSSHHSPLEDG